MKYKTLKNMEKVVDMIIAKGYEREEANDIAIKCFDNMKEVNNGMPIEWFINQIATKDVYVEETQKWKK